MTDNQQNRIKLTPKLKKVVQNFSESTSAHGPPKIVGHKYVVGKICWVLLFITGICVFTYFCCKLIIQYQQYESTFQVEMKYGQIPFPAVSFCNLNPFRLDKLPPSELLDVGNIEGFYAFAQKEAEAQCQLNNYVEALRSQNSEMTTEYRNSTLANSSTSKNRDNTTLPSRKKRSSGSFSHPPFFYKDLEEVYSPPPKWPSPVDSNFFALGSPDYTRILAFYRLYYSQTLNDEDILTTYSHELPEMLQECSFQGKQCDSGYFYKFFDKRFGNCFTFNSGLNGDIAKANVAGPTNGLTLSFFVNQENYIPMMAQEAGMRVLLHRQGETPQMEDYGFNAATGLRTSVAMSYSTTTRLADAHYSNCTSDSSLNDIYPGTYSRLACYKSCAQKLTLNECGCGNIEFRVPRGEPACNLTMYWDCMYEMKNNFDYEVNCTCPLPCDEYQYHYTLSTAEWPSINFEPFWTIPREYESELLKKAIENQTRERIKGEFVSLEIYFDSLFYTKYYEKASMTLEDLIGSIGGHLGLWIGMSVISFVEVFELIAGLCAACGKYFHKRRSASSDTPDDETEM
ncbi:SCNN1G [Bugula neritina]|uniref:SCNN1G n=1 Tax=Bugula neritina TaxID=10212 RepID=A0A7J7K5T8_BUGNE|nr:SCNN1G [Bugula neritina]